MTYLALKEAGFFSFFFFFTPGQECSVETRAAEVNTSPLSPTPLFFLPLAGAGGSASLVPMTYRLCVSSS